MSQNRLRKEAEKLVNAKKTADSSHTDPEKALHELQVYQIELELQNDELKRSSEELVKSHKRFTDLFEHAPVGYFLLAEDLTIINVNLSGCIMLDKPKEKVTGSPFHQYIAADSQDKFYFLTQKVLDTDNLFTEEIKIRKDENSAFYTQLQCIRDFDALTGAKRIRLVMFDISERKSIEKKLKRFRAALDSSADSIFLIDWETAYFIDVNDAACRNIGFTRAEFLKMMPQDINPEYTTENILKIRDEKLNNPDQSATLEMQYVRRSGTRIDVEVFLKTVTIDDEKLIVAIARDITERKKSRDQLAAYAHELEEVNKGKDKFLSIISHDLRGPFLGLKGYTQMLIEEYDLLEKEEILDYLGKVHDSSKDLYTLVDNLLKWSRLELGKIPYEPMPFNLFDEMESLMKLLTGIAGKKEIKLENNIDKEIYPFADRLMLISVIQNLVGNAIKFTRKAGYVKISAKERGTKILVQVEDNGIGITNDVKEKLFTLDKGHTSRGTAGEKGTGFGLIIAKEMIRKMGGDLYIESEPGKGSTFSFTLQKSDYKP